MKHLLLCAAAALAACTSTGQPTPQTTQVLNTAVAEGQLFCAIAQGPVGALVVGIVNAADAKAVTVTGKASGYVASICALVNGIPVVPPAVPGAVPAIAVVPPKA